MKQPQGVRLAALATLLMALSCGERNPLFLRPALRLGVLSPGVVLIDLPLDVSPDGRWLLFARRTPTGDQSGIFLQAVHPDSTARYLMPVDPLFLNPTELRFSPDGRKIAMILSDSSGTRVHVHDIASGADQAVSPGEFIASSPDWDPTGRYLVYDRPWLQPGAPDSAGGIHIVDLVTMEDRPLRHNGLMTYGGRPRWSPDGAWIAFWYGTRLDANSPPSMAIHIYRVSPQGENYADLTTGFRSDHYDPTWVRGGSGLLFEVISSTLSSTCSASADGTNRRALPVHVLGSALVVVSRDGAKVVFSAEDPAGEYGVLYIQGTEDVSGGSRQQLTFPPSSADVIAESPARIRTHADPAQIHAPQPFTCEVGSTGY